MFNLNLIEKIKSDLTIYNKMNTGLVQLSTDSRKYESGEMFIALRGENFDGFSYAQGVLEKGCPVIVYTNTDENQKKLEALKEKYSETTFIGVESTLGFLQELASLRIRQWQELGNRKTIAITGSNGKTTNKEMLFHFLNSINPNKVHCTKGNFNNHIGVPLTILDIEDEHEVAIIEMGTNHMGEIPVLCEIANPDIGYITNIGDAHLEFFKERKNIFKEKGSVFDYINKNKTESSFFLVNGDDEFLKTINADFTKSIAKETADFNYKISKNEVLINDDVKLENNHINEQFNFYNLAATFLLSLTLYPNKKNNLIESAKNFELPKNNRSQWIDVEKKKIYLDAYNANPSSMTSSLNSFKAYLDNHEINVNRAYFILGDMNELGDLAEQMHKDIAAQLTTHGVTKVCFVGRYCDFYKSGFSGEAKTFISTEDLKKEWPAILNDADYLFIKGSRSLQLESLIDIT